MRKKSKYKPKGVRVDAINWVLAGLKPMNSIEYVTTLRIRNHAAMDALRQRGWAPDYITLRRQHDLSPVTGPCAEPLVVLGAAKLGKTRLIDNLEV